jgi:hypothetical protein
MILISKNPAEDIKREIKNAKRNGVFNEETKRKISELTLERENKIEHYVSLMRNNLTGIDARAEALIVAMSMFLKTKEAMLEFALSKEVMEVGWTMEIFSFIRDKTCMHYSDSNNQYIPISLIPDMYPTIAAKVWLMTNVNKFKVEDFLCNTWAGNFKLGGHLMSIHLGWLVEYWKERIFNTSPYEFELMYSEKVTSEILNNTMCLVMNDNSRINPCKVLFEEDILSWYQANYSNYSKLRNLIKLMKGGKIEILKAIVFYLDELDD